MLAIEILMQAIIVPGAILQQQRRRPDLTGVMASLQECLVPVGIMDVDPHGLVPAIGDPGELRIQDGAQLRDQIGQRIGEVFVFAAAKAVAAHHDPAAKIPVVGIKRRDGAALVWRQ